jgi:lipoic acid synthetase
MAQELVQLGKKPKPSRHKQAGDRPPWLRVVLQDNAAYQDVNALMQDLSLNTVCKEARCPNIWECWGKHKTATFMILGDTCTRNCRYCSVKSGRPEAPPDPQEPAHVAEAVVRMGLKHAVITSVDRDDLDDKGAGHFVNTINAIRARSPETRIELLIPDFLGDPDALRLVLDAKPDILDHNTETVPRLYKRYRSKGIYRRTLDVLQQADAYRREHQVAMHTKTGLMLGLGETFEEVLKVMDDLRQVGCDVLTLGQYLNPTAKHAPIVRYYTPEEFARLKEEAMARGFWHCESGPLVRSSYHAHEHMPVRPQP